MFSGWEMHNRGRCSLLTASRGEETPRCGDDGRSSFKTNKYTRLLPYIRIYYYCSRNMKATVFGSLQQRIVDSEYKISKGSMT